MTKPQASPLVYLIGEASSPIAKIGWSGNVKARLRALQAAQSTRAKLHILATAVGGEILESHLHGHFAHLRIHGEWFDFGDRDRVLEFKRGVWFVKHPESFRPPQTAIFAHEMADLLGGGWWGTASEGSWS